MTVLPEAVRFKVPPVPTFISRPSAPPKRLLTVLFLIVAVIVAVPAQVP